MTLRRDVVGAAHHPGIFGGAVFAQLLQQLIQAGIEFALGAIAVKMERQVAGRRHDLFYARRTIMCDRETRFPQGERASLWTPFVTAQIGLELRTLAAAP